jgi:hypothetical protein
MNEIKKTVSQNRDEIFKQLHKVFGGNEGMSLTVAKYEKLSPEIGLVEAEKYLVNTEKKVQTSLSDWSYWLYKGDETLATILVAVFICLKHGIDKFKPMPDVTDMILMNKQSTLVEWAEHIIAEGR